MGAKTAIAIVLVVAGAAAAGAYYWLNRAAPEVAAEAAPTVQVADPAVEDEAASEDIVDAFAQEPSEDAEPLIVDETIDESLGEIIEGEEFVDVYGTGDEFEPGPAPVEEPQMEAEDDAASDAQDAAEDPTR